MAEDLLSWKGNNVWILVGSFCQSDRHRLLPISHPEHIWALCFMKPVLLKLCCADLAKPYRQGLEFRPEFLACPSRAKQPHQLSQNSQESQRSAGKSFDPLAAWDNFGFVIHHPQCLCNLDFRVRKPWLTFLPSWLIMATNGRSWQAGSVAWFVLPSPFEHSHSWISDFLAVSGKAAWQTCRYDVHQHATSDVKLDLIFEYVWNTLEVYVRRDDSPLSVSAVYQSKSYLDSTGFKFDGKPKLVGWTKHSWPPNVCICNRASFEGKLNAVWFFQWFCGGSKCNRSQRALVQYASTPSVNTLRRRIPIYINIYTPHFFMLSCKVNHDHAHHLYLWTHEPIVWRTQVWRTGTAQYITVLYIVYILYASIHSGEGNLAIQTNDILNFPGHLLMLRPFASLDGFASNGLNSNL